MHAERTHHKHVLFRGRCHLKLGVILHGLEQWTFLRVLGVLHEH